MNVYDELETENSDSDNTNNGDEDEALRLKILTTLYSTYHSLGGQSGCSWRRGRRLATGRTWFDFSRSSRIGRTLSATSTAHAISQVRSILMRLTMQNNT